MVGEPIAKGRRDESASGSSETFHLGLENITYFSMIICNAMVDNDK